MSQKVVLNRSEQNNMIESTKSSDAQYNNNSNHEVNNHNQGGNSKRNKKNKKQGSLITSNTSNQQVGKSLDSVLNSLQGKQSTSMISQELIPSNNGKIATDFLSLVDSQELQNNTILNIQKNLQNQSNISPIINPQQTPNIPIQLLKNSSSDYKNNQSVSSSSTSPPKNSHQQQAAASDDGFITVKRGDILQNDMTNPQYQNGKNSHKNKNSNQEYKINVFNSNNSTNQIEKSSNNSNVNTNGIKKQQYSKNTAMRKSEDFDQLNENNNGNISYQKSNQNSNVEGSHKRNNHSSGNIEYDKQSLYSPQQSPHNNTHNHNSKNQGNTNSHDHSHRHFLKTGQRNSGKRSSLQYVADEHKQINTDIQKGSSHFRQSSDQSSHEQFKDVPDLTHQTQVPSYHKQQNNHQEEEGIQNQSNVSTNSKQGGLKRKKTNKSKSIIENSEGGIVNSQQQGNNEGSKTTKNDPKAKDDANFTSIHCLESVTSNQQSSQLQNTLNENLQAQNTLTGNQTAITSVSCNNLPPMQPLQREKSLSGSDDKDKEKEDGGNLAIFRCPLALEKYSIKLWIVYIDNMIEVMFKMPIELIKLLVVYILTGQKIQKCDYQIWAHVILVLIPVLIFTDNLFIIEMKEYFDVSYWYHAFRGQSTLKLYGVLMTAEVIDKMLCTFGEYLILDVLWQKFPKGDILTIVKYLIPGVLYVFLHSLVLFLSIIGHNVILNSDISFLFVMIFVHNSMKLKSIFKKFNKDGYVQQTHQDLRSRFSKFLYVFLIWVSMRGFSDDIVRKLTYFLGSEIIVEWFKHIFLILLNNLKMSIVESMSKACKVFVAQVRIIPAFQAQEIINNKTMQTFLERENYLAQTMYVSPSLKIGFRVNFLAFHHAVIVIKVLYPLLVHYFTYHTFWIAVLSMRTLQIINDLLLYKFSIYNNDIIKLYALKNQSLFKTIFNKLDYLIFAHGLFSIYQLYQPQMVTSIAIIYTDLVTKI